MVPNHTQTQRLLSYLKQSRSSTSKSCLCKPFFSARAPSWDSTWRKH